MEFGSRYFSVTFEVGGKSDGRIDGSVLSSRRFDMTLGYDWAWA